MSRGDEPWSDVSPLEIEVQKLRRHFLEVEALAARDSLEGVPNQQIRTAFAQLKKAFFLEKTTGEQERATFRAELERARALCAVQSQMIGLAKEWVRELPITKEREDWVRNA